MKNPRKKIILVLIPAILCLLSASALAFIFLGMKQKSLRSIEAGLEAESEIKKREDIKSASRLIASTEEERRDLLSHFTKSSNLAPFLDYVEGLGIQAGTKTKITSVFVSKDSPQRLEIEAVSSGDFQSLFQLFLLFENSKYEVEFYSVRFSKDATEGWKGYFKIALLSFISQ